MTEHTHAVTLSRPEPLDVDKMGQPLPAPPRRLLDHRRWLVEAALRARWGDRYAVEHAMTCSLYGYDPVTLTTVRAVTLDDGSTRFDPDPDGDTYLLKLADDDIRAAHMTADLMLQFAGELAAQQLDDVATQFHRRHPSPVARRDDMLAVIRRRAANLRHDASRAVPREYR